MKIKVIEHIVDRGVNELDSEVYEYSNCSTFEELFKTHLIEHEDHTEESYNKVIELLESGKWYGGKWSKLGKYIIQFESDVCEIQYQLVN